MDPRSIRSLQSCCCELRSPFGFRASLIHTRALSMIVPCHPYSGGFVWIDYNSKHPQKVFFLRLKRNRQPTRQQNLTGTQSLLRILSQVCRRLRRFALPLYWQDLHLDKVVELVETLIRQRRVRNRNRRLAHLLQEDAASMRVLADLVNNNCKFDGEAEVVACRCQMCSAEHSSASATGSADWDSRMMAFPTSPNIKLKAAIKLPLTNSDPWSSSDPTGLARLIDSETEELDWV